MGLKRSIFCIFVVFFFIRFLPIEARTLTPRQNAVQPETKKSWIITKALLDEIGVSPETIIRKEEVVPPKKRERKVKPPKKKVKPPSPLKKKRDLDKGLFSDDDDFMDDSDDDDMFSSDNKLFESDGKTAGDVLKNFQEARKRIKDDYANKKKKWEGDLQKTLKRWNKEKEEFFKRIDVYKENLVEEEVIKPPPQVRKLIKPKPPEKIVKIIKIKNYHIIPGAFNIPVRDQGARGTCSSFTAIRAIEIILAQNRIQSDLSEQYFYWASKPKCQTAPCTGGGSWFGHGLIRSRDSSNPDIPLENSCPYKKRAVKGNETQIPLESGCYSGSAKVTEFHGIKNDQILRELTNNNPVMGAYKLSPNFYRTKGLVTYADSFKAGKKDAHAAGHAILLVGYVKLPQKYQRKEGKYCYITANSWSEGWGKGGYGCLTERWLNEYTMYHMTVSRVEFDL